MSYLLLFLCGSVTALPYVCEYLFFLPYFSIVPLFVIAKRKKSAYRHGLCFSMGYYLVVYHWFCYLYPMDFAGISKGGSVGVIALAWVGLSLLQALGTALVPVIYRRLTVGRYWLFAPFAGAAAWCVGEWAQNLFWFGVPWARLSVTQHKILPLIQSASVVGSLGVSFIIVLIAAFLCEGYLRYVEGDKVRVPVLAAAGIFVLNLVFGTVSLAIPRSSENTFLAATIQGNISSSDKWADNSVSASLNTYRLLTEKAVESTSAKLVVWPETVIVTDLNKSESTCNAISTLAKELDCYIAVGAFYADGDDDYNAIYLFHPDGSINESVYKKRHLVPFGEYLPMADILYAVCPPLKSINMFDQPLTQGKDSELFDTKLGKLGALVCFDSIYENLSLNSVRDGASIIILSTNDSWYRDSAAVRQHNGHAVLRAVENGRYVVRAANTGISTLISDKGRVLSSLPPLTDGYTAAEVCTASYRTVFSYTGNLIVLLCAVYLGYLSVSAVIIGSRKKLLQNSNK